MTGKPITIEMKVSDNPTYEVELRWARPPHPGHYIHITGKCAICNRPLENRFPKDFPNDWKFCCSCLHIAHLIIEGNLMISCWRHPKPHKILAKISLMNYNE